MQSPLVRCAHLWSNKTKEYLIAANRQEQKHAHTKQCKQAYPSSSFNDPLCHSVTNDVHDQVDDGTYQRDPIQGLRHIEYNVWQHTHNLPQETVVSVISILHCDKSCAIQSSR